MSWTRIRPVRRARRRSPVIDIVVLASQGYARHLASRNAALLAYYGFLTLFPLIMVATTVLGFFLQGDPELRTEIVESAISQIPVLGDQILNQSGQIGGSLTALVIGLASGLWGSTRAFAALQTALDDAWEVPVEHRPNLVVRRCAPSSGCSSSAVPRSPPSPSHPSPAGPTSARSAGSPSASACSPITSRSSPRCSATSQPPR